MTMQEFYQAGINRSMETGETLEQIIKDNQPKDSNAVKSLLKMLRFDILPEPVRSLAESLNRRYNK
jgi:hypothetical protein